jgi:hypothetical protein
LTVGKHRPSLLKAKVNQSTTQLNAQLLITGAPILARSHHFANPSAKVETVKDDKADSVSVRSQSEDIVEGDEPDLATNNNRND